MLLKSIKTVFGLAKIIKSLDMVTAYPWTDYSGTSTIVGWSSRTTTIIEYKMITGGLVFVHFRIIGTSNATTTSFTLPYSEGSSTNFISTCLCEDNGTRAIGYLVMATSTVSFVPNATGSTSSWTATGDKEIYGEFWYETA